MTNVSVVMKMRALEMREHKADSSVQVIQYVACATKNTCSLSNVHWLNRPRPIETKRITEHAVRIQISKQTKISSSLLHTCAIAIYKLRRTESMGNSYEVSCCRCTDRDQFNEKMRGSLRISFSHHVTFLCSSHENSSISYWIFISPEHQILH